MSPFPLSSGTSSASAAFTGLEVMAPNIAASTLAEEVHGALRERVPFLAPEFPADVSVDVFAFRCIASRTIRVASMTSMPMPSPGSQAIVYVLMTVLQMWWWFGVL